jgi:hypothetical protein
MRSLTSSGLLSVLAVTVLSASGCRRTTTDDSSVSASVEEAQKESKEAYDRAKEAQDDAIDEQREATRAQDNVNERRQELAEAEAKAARELEESQAAQAQAQREGEVAQQQAQEAQARASQLQQQQFSEHQAGAGSYSTAQARTSEPRQRQTRSAQSRDSSFSWVRPGAWNSAPRTTEPASDEPTDEVTRMVQATAAATVIDEAILQSVTNEEIVVTSSDATGFHMVNAKVTSETRVVKDGHAATLGDIKQGDHVKVSYHMENTKPVADSVEILSGGQ